MMNLKKQLITTLVVWTISCTSVIQPMEKPSGATDTVGNFERLEKQDILIRDYNGGQIKFSKMMVCNQLVFCIINDQGSPELFSTAIKKGIHKFFCITMCSGRSRTLMKKFRGGLPLFEQDNIKTHLPDFYRSF